MSKKLWGGRFDKSEDALTESFNESISFDRRLYLADIAGNIAHAKMLAEVGIITQEDCDLILKGLDEIKNDIANNRVELRQDLEDIHMNIETLLTERIGEAGKRLHTARSRNDQVATDFMLFVRDAIDKIVTALIDLIQTLIHLAEVHTETIMPGYTHLQRAQPITFAHYLLAYCQMFTRDINRFNFVKESDLNKSPLGAGALAGTTYPIDREMTSLLLEFDGIKENSLDAVSDRDFALDFLSACAVTMMHLSRLCEEIILYNSAEFNFLTLDDAYTTGSSIMPQKKNPDIAELIRGKTGRSYGNLIALLTTMKGLPLAYNKDMQEDKEPVFDSFDTVYDSLVIINRVIATMKVNKEKMLSACEEGFLNATDMADWLVKHGIPFRSAHEIIGKLVLYCENKEIRLSDLTLEELKSFEEVFDTSVFDAIRLDEMIAKRSIPGGPAPEIVKKEIQRLKEMISDYKSPV